MNNELVRVAILWNELWHEVLEEASRLFFGEHELNNGTFSNLFISPPSEQSNQQMVIDSGEDFDLCFNLKEIN